MHTLVALLVFAIGLGATLYYWGNLRDSVNTSMDTAYAKQTQTIGKAMLERLHLYENFLRGNAGLFSIITVALTPADWDKYHQPYEISKKYPDVQAIGLIRTIDKAEIPAYLDRRVSQGDSNFKIFPEGDRALVAPITFVTDYNGKNTQRRGFDSYTDPVQRRAMDRAVESNRMTMSGKVEPASEKGPGRSLFLLYFPVYQKNQPVGTLTERRAALLGFVFLTIDAKTFIDGTLTANQNPNIAMRVYDREVPVSQQLVYESQNFANIQSQRGAKVVERNSHMYEHDWHVSVAGSPALISARERQLPDQALWRGLVTCIFFAGLVWYLITDRERKYARQKQEEVQTAKDDLLSLASHQLRTPATVVKQYVGMMLQGYAGNLTSQQLEMLSNAYNSNERQLEIINQLLYVARLDAGRITLHRKKTDIAKLMQDVVKEHKELLVSRHQTLRTKLPKKPLIAEIDPHYIRMVADNLLSNAIKYTPEKGSIALEVRRSASDVVLVVKDTGVGIEASAQADVFEKFTRVENELSTDVNGSGVGLYLTKEIVELHGGRIRVKSVSGEGSTFTVLIPIRPPRSSGTGE